ncbi:MAG TPA: hypothetical protein VFO83_02075 [Aggregicoccus sp.]|nr:hypothetical protein [Aggregicoccus sp.]
MTMPAESSDARRRLPGAAPAPWALPRAAPALSWRALLAAGLVLAQLAFMCVTHLSGSPYRFFVWAPNDYSRDYVISAQVNGRTLSSEELEQRYRLSGPSNSFESYRGFYEDPPVHLTQYLRMVEQKYGGQDSARITLRYTLNGHDPVVWTWSRP